jgi:hypothetical protein
MRRKGDIRAGAGILTPELSMEDGTPLYYLLFRLPVGIKAKAGPTKHKNPACGWCSYRMGFVL